jgi:uncharacterized protein
MDPIGALFESAKKHNAEGIVQALEQGADVNATDETGRTALMYACEWILITWGLGSQVENAKGKQKNSVNTLLEAGAHVDVKDQEGLTALLIAVEEPEFINAEIVQLLISAGANTQELLERHPTYLEDLKKSLITSTSERKWCSLL